MGGVLFSARTAFTSLSLVNEVEVL